jgi:hypothetical protein
MRKLIGIGLASAVALSLFGTPATARLAPQKVDGAIVMPAPFVQGQFAGCWGGATRRSGTVTSDGSNGLVGYHFAVDKKTWGKKFVLKATGGEGTVDLDLFLYTFYPGPEETPNDPVNGGTPVSVDFQVRKAGGEKGVVPKGATDAIVCMYAGPEYQGFNGSFTYTAG